ncbi:putative ankyrin repeat protein RF_0381 isoform X2 [Haliotis asinina]|uniref:putative ankyrin repeat protein RF_0381 isoform X2 n=1 Tax=Haliotis asinina TaxID=109174 RepID=UPI003532083C
MTTQDSDLHASTTEASEGMNRNKTVPAAPLTTQRSDAHATPSTATSRDLYDASREGDLERVKRILAAGHVDINNGGQYSRTPVMEAAVNGHRDVVELLVGRGADVTLVTDSGNNALHLACRNGNLETVKLILSLNVVDINSRGQHSRTPVMEAAVNGHVDVVELLVGRGADVSLVTNSGNNALHLACRNGNLETVKLILSLNVVDINSRGQHYRTPVMEAAVNGHMDVVELLVGREADVSLVTDSGNTALHLACRNGNLETVKLILSLNVVDINSRGQHSRTPVMEAAVNGHVDVVELLVGRGADVSLVTNSGNNALHLACRNGNLETVKLILSLNVVDINSRGQHSRTPVMEAAVNGHRDVMEVLVGRGADVSLVTNSGNNVLHLACRNGDLETVKLILSLDVVDINSRGQYSRTPVMEAAANGHRDVVELLAGRGADVSLVDVYDNVLHWA